MRWALVWAALIALILVPFFLFEARFTALAEMLTSGTAPRATAAAAIAALLAADVLLPVPSSIVSTGAGALLGFGLGTAVVWGGMTAGCVAAYLLGARAAGAAQRLVGDASLERARQLSSRYGAWTIVICRPVPVLAEATAVMAGLTRAPWKPFLSLTAMANLGIAAGYAAVGAFAIRVDSFLLAFAGALLIPAAAMMVATRASRRA